MSQSLLWAFIVFAFAMLFTPGPNNIMLMSSGLTYGFRRTLPHIAGVAIGFAFMVGAVGIGFGTVILAYPVLQQGLKYAGAAYLIYLAVVIAMSGPVKPDPVSSGPAKSGLKSGLAKVKGRGPMTFLGAAIFQWVNVKGWVIVIGTVTAYAAMASFPWNILFQAVITLVVGTLSAAVWAVFGTALRPFLTSERLVRAFNVVMAVLLLASLYPVFMDA